MPFWERSEFSAGVWSECVDFEFQCRPHVVMYCDDQLEHSTVTHDQSDCKAIHGQTTISWTHSSFVRDTRHTWPATHKPMYHVHPNEYSWDYALHAHVPKMVIAILNGWMKREQWKGVDYGEGEEEEVCVKTDKARCGGEVKREREREREREKQTNQYDSTHTCILTYSAYTCTCTWWP